MQSRIALATIHERLHKILAPPPRLNIREWADEFRYLSPESAAQPGKYRSSFAPYQRAPMEDASDPTVESITLMWGSQLGKTEVVTNVIGYFMDADPSPILMVQPTVELAESFSKERLDPMIRDTPVLRGKVKEKRSRDSGNTISMKQFPGGNIALVGANAPSGLAGRPRRVVIGDEIDRMPASAGKEGDPCALAERRTETFWNAVLYWTSTPTIKGFSRIESKFEQTDKCMWFCPCPDCGQFQHLKWSQVLWGKQRIEHAKQYKHLIIDEIDPGDASDAIYACEQCHAHLTDKQRREMVMAGEWRATAPFKGKRGYHFSGIASPFKHKKGFKSRLHQMAAGFLEAKHGGRETFKTWVNTFLAETFEDEGEKVDWAGLITRGEDYNPGKLPSGIIVASASVDVQKDRVEVETVGLGMSDESWGIEKRVIHGDTEQDDVWQDLGEFLTTKYQREDGIELPITATAIDMRHKPKKVQAFIRKCGLPRVYPVYGVASNTPILVTTRFNKHYRLRTYAVNGKLAKNIVFARLRVEEPGPRYMHFPKAHGYDEEHFRQLTGEVLKTKYLNGFPTQYYEKIRDRNEALDIRVYWLACLDILKPALNAFARKQESQKRNPEEESKPPTDYVLHAEVKPEAKATKPQRQTQMPRRGFINKWR